MPRNNNKNTFSKVTPTEIPLDYRVKIAVIGKDRSGKTSLINRYCDDSFSQNYQGTVSANLRTIVKELTDGKKVNCQIWDAGSNDIAKRRYRYLRDCDAVIFVADATSFDSLEELKNKFIPLVDIKCRKNPIKIFALTKTDYNYYSGDDLRKITDRIAEAFAKQQNMLPFIKSLSAKEGDVINEFFDSVIEQVLARQIAQKYKEQFVNYLNGQLKHLPPSSEKHMGFNKIKLSVNSKECSLYELKKHVGEARGLAKQHRDTGIVGFFKGTWFRDPNSRKIHEETFDAQNNIKRHP